VLRTISAMLAMSAALTVGPANAQATDQHAGVCGSDPGRITALVQKLIDNENRHDVSAMRAVAWDSPNMLFVAKTATLQEGNWAGFWGTHVVMQHFHDLYRGHFHMAPDYGRERIASLTCDVAEVYLPVGISVDYGGQNPSQKPFIILLDWISTAQGWKLATDVALPIPPSPKAHP
jgi:hypothetical protein